MRVQSTRLKTLIASLAIGVIVIYLLVNKMNIQPLIIYLLAIAVLFLIGMTILNRICVKSDARFQNSIDDNTQQYLEVVNIPIQAARDRVATYLQEANQYKVIKDEDSRQIPLYLSPLLQEFFSLYREVTGPGELVISRDLISPSTWNPNLYRIGTDYEHAEIAVKPGEERIYILDGSEGQTAQLVNEAFDSVITRNSFPSIYHFLLYFSD